MSGDPLDDLGEVAHDVLRRMLREVLARRPGGHLVEPSLTSVELRLRLPLRGPASAPEAFAAELRAALEAVVDDAVEEAAAFRPGEAFCHRCGHASCPHSAPPSGRHVFAGYGPTGLPRFEDFAQRCLDRRHPDVDRLYADPPAFVTWVEDGEAMNRDLVLAFAAPRCELLGQVVAGFYPVPVHDREGRGVLALTFQAMATRRRDGSRRLGLNVLGRTPGGEDLAFLFERQPELPWRAAVRWAQGALQSVERPSRERVRAILQGLARRLTRDRRARGRRTAHAEVRHAEGDRPTRQALVDVRAARRETVLVDARSRALVVLGARGRTHFFSPEGKLISSVRYSREAIERKRKLGLWREASAQEAGALDEVQSPIARDPSAGRADGGPAEEGAAAAASAAAAGPEGAGTGGGGGPRQGREGRGQARGGGAPEVS